MAREEITIEDAERCLKAFDEWLKETERRWAISMPDADKALARSAFFSGFLWELPR